MGALSGYTVIELAGIGPAPMGMMLADMGVCTSARGRLTLKWRNR